MYHSLSGDFGRLSKVLAGVLCQETFHTSKVHSCRGRGPVTQHGMTLPLDSHQKYKQAKRTKLKPKRQDGGENRAPSSEILIFY